MPTAAEDRLGDVRRRLDRLDARAQQGTEDGRSRMQPYIDAVRRDEEDARASARQGSDAVTERLEQLDASLELAEHRVAAELAATQDQVTNSLKAALNRWDTNLDRMQTKAAAKGGVARERAEAAIADLRQHRVSIGAHVAAVGTAGGEGWHDTKAQALAELDELKTKAKHPIWTEESEVKTELTYEVPVLQAGERALARVWKLIALRGVVAIAFAIVLLISPDIGLTAMVWAVGVFSITSGFVSLAAVFALPAAGKGNRFWLGLHAVFGLVGGTAILLWPDISSVALLYAIALWAIAAGVIELVSAFMLPLSGPRRVLVAVGGIALAAFGGVMFVNPGEGAVALLALVSAFALVRGTFDVALAVQLRKFARELGQPFRSVTGAKPTTHG